MGSHFKGILVFKISVLFYSIFVQRLRNKPWTYMSKFFVSIYLFIFFSVILYPIFFASNWLMPWFLVAVLTYRLFRTLNPAIQELG